MTAGELYRSLADRGIALSRQGDALTAAPKELLTDDDRAAIRQHKAALLDMLALDDEALTALDALQPVNWPADGQGHGITILTGPDGWRVALLSEDLEALVVMAERWRAIKRAERDGAAPKEARAKREDQHGLFDGE